MATLNPGEVLARLEWEVECSSSHHASEPWYHQGPATWYQHAATCPVCSTTTRDDLVCAAYAMAVQRSGATCGACGTRIPSAMLRLTNFGDR